MSDSAPIADRHQRLQLFFSADLSGGTAFKNQYPVERIGYAQAWPTVFEQFFREFDRAFGPQRLLRASWRLLLAR